MSSYIRSVYPGLQEVLEWCEDREQSISSEELSKAFGDEADALDQVSNLAEKSSELASALQMVTQKEPVAIVINCGTSGFEAWRWLTRRYDPATASRKRTMLKTVISPQKQKLESLPRRAIEEWMDAVRTYEKRRDAAGNRTSIPDEIKTAALEAMLPPDLESLVQMNQARFTTFDELLEEIMRYLEHKTGKSLKMASAASTLANQSSHLLGTKEDRKAVEASFSELVTTVAKPATKPQSVGPNRVRRDMRPATRKAHTEKVQGTRTRTLEKLEKDPRVDQ